MNISNKRIGLALSGGGIRAAVFHLGVLKYLAESGLFGNITGISSVSGASLCIGAIFAAGCNRWPSGEQFLNVTLPSVRETLLSCDIEKSAFLRLPLSPRNWLNRSEIIADVLEKKWGITGTLRDLPDYSEGCHCPYWEINCAAYETGELFRIRRDYMGGAGIGYTRDHLTLRISHMIAASAAFPGLIGPYPLKTKGMNWTKDKNNAEINSRVASKYTLWDGGVYDNLGLEPLFKNGQTLDAEIDFLIVSDASAPLEFKRYETFTPFHNIKRITRLTGIPMNQVRKIRKREFLTAVAAKGRGAYLQINGHARHYPTTLKTPSKPDFHTLLTNGHKTAESALNT